MDNKTAGKQERGYTAAVIIFIIGIIAVAAAMIIGLSNINFRLLICEGVALICLIGLLVVSVRAKRSAARQRDEHRRNPYASVNKKEIDKVLDMIVEEEKKRKRLDAFAAGLDMKSANNSEKISEPEEPEADEGDPDADIRLKLAQAAMEADEESEDVMPIVFDDDEEVKAKDDAPNEEKDTNEVEPEIKGEEESEVNGNYRDDYDERPARRRPPEERERRERDPYYDDYYADRPRSRERDPRDPYASRGYYNEYGEPVRRRRPPAYDPYYDDYYAERPRSRERDPRDPRSRDPYAARGYYNDYGEPARRRPPQDERDRYQQRRRRPSDDYYEGRPRPEDDRRRPDTAGVENPVIDEEEKNNATPVPEETAPAPKKEYDEDYVPIVIPDDERDEYAVAHTGRAGVGSLNRENRSGHKEENRHHTPHRSQPQYSSYDDEEMESMPIAFADDEEYERRYAEEDNYSHSTPQRSNEHQRVKKQDKYVPDYEDEEMVVSLPRDDGYEEYMEEKLAEERKAERLAKRKESGKIVLTIAKIRRRKIRRKSRKYKTFRASVHHLADYLNSFTGNK